MGIKIVNGVIVVSILFLIFLAVKFAPNLQTVVPCESVQAEIDVYRACMQSAGKTGCRMQVNDFRKYHQLKADLAGRCADLADAFSIIEPLSRSSDSVAD